MKKTVICNIDSCIHHQYGYCQAERIVINPLKSGTVTGNFQTYCQTFEWDSNFYRRFHADFRANINININVNIEGDLHVNKENRSRYRTRN